MAKLLLVDGDRHNRTPTEDLLESTGHEVRRARNSLEALTMIRQQAFDLAIIDLDFLKTTTCGLIGAIRQNRPQTMILALASKDSSRTAEAWRYGAYDVITGDFNQDELGNHVSGALAESRAMARAGYVYKNPRGRDAISTGKRMVLAGIDAILVGLTFLAALTREFEIARIGDAVAAHMAELAAMSLGLIFCHIFILIYRRAYFPGNGATRTEKALHFLGNITYSYVMFLAILFLTDSAKYLFDRTTVILGYLAGLGALALNNLLIQPLLSARLRREGRRKFRIVGMEKASFENSESEKIDSSSAASATNRLKKLEKAVSRDTVSTE